jgi:7-carboxy-7-deazaguanine synthase
LASYINNTIVLHHEDGIYDDNSYFPLIDKGPKFQLKFVYSGEESLVEIKDILDKLVEESGYPKEIIYGSVLLMPEAGSKDQLENNSEECVKVCLENGFRFCDRLHLRIWGNKRCV